MPRPIWKGHISFGLVNIPVVLHPAENRSEMSFRLLDSRNKARIKYERVNETTGEPVPWDEIVKAYEYDDGNYVVLTDEDFKRAAAEATQTIEITEFIDRNQLDDRYFDKPYYLVPDHKGEKGYVLLRETLARTGKVGIAKVVIRTRQYLAALEPLDNALVLYLLRFHDELRDIQDFDLPERGLKDHKISSKEVDLAERLVDSMASRWEPEKYHDEYRDALMKWIQKKATQGDTAESPKPVRDDQHDTGEIFNFMDVLKRSVEARTKEKKPAGRVKAPARKAPARRKRA